MPQLYIMLVSVREVILYDIRRLWYVLTKKSYKLSEVGILAPFELQFCGSVVVYYECSCG